MTDDPWLIPLPPRELEGSEPFIGTQATVLDFWRFSASNLQTNTLRGLLAEFLVGLAVGLEQARRVEWEPYDVVAPDGTTIEVKSSAYLQALEQKKPSQIVFSGLKARGWTPREGYDDVERYRAQVYVFCLQTAVSHAEYDALDVGQWEFYVAGHDAVEKTGAKSLGLGAVRVICGEALGFDELKAAIERAAY